MRKYLIILTLFITYNLGAQGVNSMFTGAKSLSLGGVNAIYVKDASSSYFNPAITSLLDNHTATGGLGLISSKTAYLNTDFSDEQENATQPLLFPFNVYGVYKIDNNMAASISVNSPFGLGKRWDDEWTGRYIVQDFRFKTQYIQPAFSYLIREDLSIGLGVILARSSMLYKSRLDFQDIDQRFTANALGFGANIGVWGKINSGTEYGVSFKTPINYKYKKGSSQLDNIPEMLNSSINNTESVYSSFKTPYQLSIAMSNRIAEKIYLSYQFDLDGWKVFNSQQFDFENDNIPDLNFNKNFKNSFTFKVGGEYHFNEQFYFRGGFYYKETPVADQFLTPEFPVGSALGYTLGASYIVDQNFSVDLGILYENQAKRSFLNEQLQFGGRMETLIYGIILGINYTL